MDMNALIDAFGSSNLSNKDFHTQKGRFDNESVARVTPSFGRELLTIFGKMETSASSTVSSPLPAITSYT